jgi:hypothetical protein
VNFIETHFYFVGFEVFTVACTKTAVFWVGAVEAGGSLPTFRRALLPPSTGRYISIQLFYSYKLFGLNKVEM